MYIIKSWKCNETADETGVFVNIKGRKRGFISLLLSFVGAAFSVSLVVRDNEVEFTLGSLSSTLNFRIPSNSISSTLYGCINPLPKALVVFALVSGIAPSICAAMEEWYPVAIGIGGVLGLILAIYYYFSNRAFILGIVENSGKEHLIPFKPSMAQSLSINEAAASKVCAVIQRLIERKNSVQG